MPRAERPAIDWTPALAAREAITRRLAAAWQTLVAVRAELAVSAALLGGWASITIGITHLTASNAVWPLSTGVLLLSLCGWKFIYGIARDGLYTLTAEERSRHE